MLRRRHAPFEIDFAVRDIWFECMMQAVDDTPPFAVHRELLERYFADAATFLINKLEPKTSGEVLPQI